MVEQTLRNAAATIIDICVPARYRAFTQARSPMPTLT